MKMVTLKDVLDATGGRLLGKYDNLDTEIRAVGSNTRVMKRPGMMKDNEMFVAFKGDEIDGHDFISESFELGCIGCLTEREFDAYDDCKFYVLVNDTLEALWKIVALIRSRVRAQVICVTGSVGKTTTTGLIANVLRQKYSVFATEENYNDEFIGPEMVFQIDDSHDIAVLELGMGMHSSVSKMAKILRPNIAVLTRIGHAHIGKTGSLEATRDEKCGIEDGLGEGGFTVINIDDPMQRYYPFKHPIVTYGRYMSDAQELHHIPRYLEYAAYAAKVIGSMFRLTTDEIKNGIATFVPESGRMDIVKKQRFTLIDSSFNASVESIEMAIDILSTFNGRKIAVIGEMFEIGDYVEELHERIGAYIKPYMVDVLISVGEHSDCVLKAVDPRVTAFAVNAIPEAWSILTKVILDGKGEDVILCKGSHASGVYQIADDLRKLEDSYGEEN